MEKYNSFTLDSGIKLPLDAQKYLYDVLSTTTEGTKYWEAPPAGELTERQVGRILLQVHQIIDILNSLGVELDGSSFLDIGTGNGLVPRALLALSGLNYAQGVDPYLDGEHPTSWQPHNHDDGLERILGKIFQSGQIKLDLESYRHLLDNEHWSFKPSLVSSLTQSAKLYEFRQLDAYAVSNLGKQFDIVYCKAIEHISNWRGVFDAVCSVSRSGTVFYLKHRSFFSYLGAHRYGSTFCPWGHVLMTDNEYKRYVNQYHSERSRDMIDFFFSGLSYPRESVSDMVRVAAEYGFTPLGIRVEPHKNIDRLATFVHSIDSFWDIVRSNYPSVSADEILSGMHHIVFKKQ